MHFSRIMIILAMWLSNEPMEYDIMTLLRTNQFSEFCTL